MEGRYIMDEKYILIIMGVVLVMLLLMILLRKGKVKQTMIAPNVEVFGVLSYEKVVNKDMLSILNKIADDEYDTFVLNYRNDREHVMDRLKIPGNEEMEAIILKTVCKFNSTISKNLINNVSMFIARDSITPFCVDEVRQRFVRANEYYTNMRAEYLAENADRNKGEVESSDMAKIKYSMIASKYGDDMADTALKYGVRMEDIETYRNKFVELTKLYETRGLDYDSLTTTEKELYDKLRDIYEGSEHESTSDDAFYKSPKFGQ